jgi:hypothetical protein
VLHVRPHDKLAQTILATRISHEAQQREPATPAVNRELSSRKRHGAPSSITAPPYGKSNQLQTLEFSSGEMEFLLHRVSQLRLRSILMIAFTMASLCLPIRNQARGVSSAGTRQ